MELGMMVDMGWLVIAPESSAQSSPRPLAIPEGRPESLNIDRQFFIEINLPESQNSAPSGKALADLDMLLIAAGIDTRATAVDSLLEDRGGMREQQKWLAQDEAKRPHVPLVPRSAAIPITSTPSPDDFHDDLPSERWGEALDAALNELTLDLVGRCDSQ
jgi:hypothetical protein